MRPVPARASAQPRIAFDIGEEILRGAGAADDTVVLTVGGEVDFAAGPRLRQCLFGHIAAGRRRLVLDLSPVTFIDSMAIGVLVGAVMRIQEAGGGWLRAVCAGENERVHRIFDIAGVASLITLSSSLEEVLAVDVPMPRRPTGEQVGGTQADGSVESSAPSRLSVTQSYTGGTSIGGAGEVDELA